MRICEDMLDIGSSLILNTGTVLMPDININKYRYHYIRDFKVSSNM